MPEHLRDLDERDVRAHHLAGHGVAETGRADLGDSGAPARPTHGRANRAGRDRLERRSRSQEHLPPVTSRSPASQIGDDRVAHLDWQRQLIMTSGLAADDELACSPVEVVDAESGHLAGAKTEPQERDQYRIVPPTERRSAVA